jgi:hypothetical protein
MVGPGNESSEKEINPHQTPNNPAPIPGYHTERVQCRGHLNFSTSLVLQATQKKRVRRTPVMRLRGSTQNIYKRSPFLPLSSAQVPCPSSSANYCPILPRVMHRRLPLKSAQATTQLTHARANHKQRKT